ncbi:MAG: pseudouridine synthase [Slackia sp.]|nr:pseudouridine synthase [Slackia sp.]
MTDNVAEERIVPMRLQKFLARAGVASRRGSENLMTAGRVCVNGVVATELGTKVDPRVDTVTVDGREVRLADGAVTLMLHKPAGFITTMSDPHGRPIVADLVPCDRYPGLFPVGRLDFDTTGLLLFSTDGELGNGLLHPRKHVDKTYEALLDGVMDERDAQRLRDGVVLDDGLTLPAHVDILRAGPKDSRVSITIHEGRKRQVKRMCGFVGHPVLALHRRSFGPIELGDLSEGSWRLLDAHEEAALRQAAGLDAQRRRLG